MHPALPDQLNIQHMDEENRSQWIMDQMIPQSPVGSRRFRAEDSWIEISSQPSSSSSNPQGNNEIATAGLRLRPGGRQMRTAEIGRVVPARSISVAGSSQDEYEESESESDRVMGSSNEDINQNVEEEDEIATALGIGSRNAFTPQPNAFTHPPMSGNALSTPAPDSYFPPVRSDRLPSNRIIPHQPIAQRQIRRDNTSLSRQQPDHDAALRASLTTLLSCAAAVRAPRTDKDQTISSPPRPSVQPTSLRLIPGSELNSEPRPQKVLSKRRSRESSKERHTKKIRALKASAVNEEILSSTVMTWMISAGVVLVFSAITFSAGYAWGKEVGRVEGQMGLQSGNYGPETLRTGGGLRKLRWSAATQSVRA